MEGEGVSGTRRTFHNTVGDMLRLALAAKSTKLIFFGIVADAKSFENKI